VELLRRAAKFENVPFTLVLQMGLLKLPEIGQIILPFAILFSALYTFWFLARRHELVIVRAAGLSVWQFLGPIIGVALLIGIFHMTVINPIGALLVTRYQAMESRYLQEKENTVSISEQGLWLRQKTDNGGIILHAGRVQMPEWKLNDVTAFFFTKKGDFVRRTDSQSAQLEPGNWTFRDVTVNAPGHAGVKVEKEWLATDLTITEIEESFSTPEQTPFWTLPSYIRTMEATGFDSRKLRIHYQSLLAQPLLFAAMVVLAATVSLRVSRFQPVALMIGGGVVIGFLMFFASSFLKALGASDQIPVLLAAWFPPLIALSLGISVILTTEDG
jgi:lipopolysaccharide export system permease protein